MSYLYILRMVIYVGHDWVSMSDKLKLVFTCVDECLPLYFSHIHFFELCSKAYARYLRALMGFNKSNTLRVSWSIWCFHISGAFNIQPGNIVPSCIWCVFNSMFFFFFFFYFYALKACFPTMRILCELDVGVGKPYLTNFCKKRNFFWKN